MSQIDDNFLEEIGLPELPQEQKKAFLQRIYNEIQMRVGARLSEGLSDEQMEQFEAFTVRDATLVNAWIHSNMPDYADRADYQQFTATAPDGVSAFDVLCEYGALKWLEMHRPNYNIIVAEETQQLKNELTKNRKAILGS